MSIDTELSKIDRVIMPELLDSAQALRDEIRKPKAHNVQSAPKVALNSVRRSVKPKDFAPQTQAVGGHVSVVPPDRGVCI